MITYIFLFEDLPAGIDLEVRIKQVLEKLNGTMHTSHLLYLLINYQIIEYIYIFTL